MSEKECIQKLEKLIRKFDLILEDIKHNANINDIRNSYATLKDEC